jgi:hypothetical protein
MKCKQCQIKVTKETSVIVLLKRFCSFECAAKFGKANIPKGKEIRRKEQRKNDKVRLKELRSRTTWFANYLQPLVNQYNRDVLHAGKPCYTCGNTNGDTKMNAGHYIPVGAGGGDRRRFMHENIKRQCEFCNTYKGGAPKEYRMKLIEENGEKWVLDLECEYNHPTLKEQFPTWQDIENEISRYRKLIREAGLTPCK